jgi:hypothetical protein
LIASILLSITSFPLLETYLNKKSTVILKSFQLMPAGRPLSMIKNKDS